MCIRDSRRILEFRFVEGTIKLYADDIIYIETELHKNVFYTEKGTFQIYKKLDELMFSSTLHLNMSFEILFVFSVSIPRIFCETDSQTYELTSSVARYPM